MAAYFAATLAVYSRDDIAIASTDIAAITSIKVKPRSSRWARRKNSSVVRGAILEIIGKSCALVELGLRTTTTPIRAGIGERLDGVAAGGMPDSTELDELRLHPGRHPTVRYRGRFACGQLSVVDDRADAASAI